VAESLVLNHGFVDGNKRSAMYAMAAWLERELSTDQVVAWTEHHSMGLTSE
jgi:prophage maintenance system killer protein